MKGIFKELIGCSIVTIFFFCSGLVPLFWKFTPFYFLFICYFSYGVYVFVKEIKRQIKNN